ncbi:MAG: hypothetical protein RL368_275 [Pseudomonadota bacterium]|jgi:transcriptional regulator with XRE-family HTH domain
MKVNERIKFLRTLKGWTQEELAEKLKMSPNGYGNIERGDSEITLSRLEQLANIFSIELSELLGLREVHIFNLIGSNNSNSQNLCNYSNEQLQILTEKQALIIEQQNKEIVYLKEIIELLKRDKI